MLSRPLRRASWFMREARKAAQSKSPPPRSGGAASKGKIGLIGWIGLMGVQALAAGAGIFNEGPGGAVTLSWAPNPEPDIAGYIVYAGTNSGMWTWSTNVGNVTTCRVDRLVYGGTYYFVVTAFNTSGLESDPSNEVCYEAPGPLVVASITNQVEEALYPAGPWTGVPGLRQVLRVTNAVGERYYRWWLGIGRE